MLLSNLLWLVALFIVLRARHTHQHPKMCGRRGDSRLRRRCMYYDSRVEDRLPHDSKSWDAIQDETSQTANYETMPCLTTCQTPRPPNAGSIVDCASQPQQEQQQYAIQPEYQLQPQPPRDDSEARGKELRKLLQHLYVAQARVQLEATEIHKAEAAASSAQMQLEDSANHVRTITANLHNAQQELAAAAIRAQIAQLQLATHDQLLFAARHDVDALSSQVVGLQAAEGIVQPKLTVHLHALLDKLRQPLQQAARPTLDDMPPAPAPVPVDPDILSDLVHGSELDPGYGYGPNSAPALDLATMMAASRRT